jgi:hypothetical protein
VDATRGNTGVRLGVDAPADTTDACVAVGPRGVGMDATGRGVEAVGVDTTRDNGGRDDDTGVMATVEFFKAK